MTWYYAAAGQQIGPITEEQFQSLVQNGTIRADTLVWSQGMANWLPYGTVAPASMPGAPAAPGESASPSGAVICAECRVPFPADQVVRFGDSFVCANCKPIYLQKMREGVVTLPPEALNYAGFWVRFGAKFVDGLIVGAVTIPVTFLLGSRMAVPPGGPASLSQILTQQALLTAFSMTVSLLYSWLFVGKYGATPGKMVFKLKIVTADGQPVTYLRAFARYWGEIVSQITCYIGYIIAAFDDEKRALHDHICSTRVVFK